jgi:hypothetical protein
VRSTGFQSNKQALQQGFTSRSRWLLQILGLISTDAPLLIGKGVHQKGIKLILLSKEERAMKKTIVATATILLSVFLVFSAGYADDLSDEGKIQIEKAKLMMEKAKAMTEFKGGDKASIVDLGQSMHKEGADMLHIGMTMKTRRGTKNLQSMGSKMMARGSMLQDKGRKKGELTAKDIKKINKLGKNLVDFAERMLQEGKTMGGN